MSSGVVNHFPFADNGARITRARERLTGPAGKPLGKEKFAALVGTTRRHMIRLENGEHLPGEGLRDRIVEVTGTDERIRCEEDEEEESLPLSAVLDPTMNTVVWLRATAKKRLRDADKIEKALLQ